ncbi:extensin family protein [Nitratireductor sp. GISD-1A_MAKvit]|uniref:extensin-like domain-containing protein n=1 Tax=Nitratireductor sp. GISD-1A_MAKvit TaxID=3234198 RepID=UPI003466CAD7
MIHVSIPVSPVTSAIAALIVCFPLSISDSSAAEGSSRPDISLPRTGPVPAARGTPQRRELSVVVPIPASRPDIEGETDQTQPPEATRPDDLPEDEVACRKKLADLGVFHEEGPPATDSIGCHLPYPVVVDHMASEIPLTREAKLNCPTALTLARFFTEQVPELAQKHLGQPIRAVEHASAYVCRTRHSSGKLSEHAFGNALDIGAFILADGTKLTVTEKSDPKSNSAKFLDAFRAAACGPFKTVLGPGSDEDHADHFHLDLRKRRNDYTYCR